jgi:hypothetical protein
VAVVPLAGATLIQFESLTNAVHDPLLQPLGLAPTVNGVDPPLAGIVATEEGLAENVQIVGVWPA